MTHTYLHGAIFECEICGDEYEDHPAAFAPHRCERCEEEGETDDDCHACEIQTYWDGFHGRQHTCGGA